MNYKSIRVWYYLIYIRCEVAGSTYSPTVIFQSWHAEVHICILLYYELHTTEHDDDHVRVSNCVISEACIIYYLHNIRGTYNALLRTS